MARPVPSNVYRFRSASRSAVHAAVSARAEQPQAPTGELRAALSGQPSTQSIAPSPSKSASGTPQPHTPGSAFREPLGHVTGGSGFSNASTTIGSQARHEQTPDALSTRQSSAIT